jgi:hypothetical protein
MASNAVYSFTYTWDVGKAAASTVSVPGLYPQGHSTPAPATPHGGEGDWYKGYTVDVAGTYQTGQVIPTEHGSYKIDAVQTYAYDLEATHGAPYAQKAVYVQTYHDGATNSDYQPYHWNQYLAGDPKAQSGHAGLGSEQDYVKVPGATPAQDQYHNFGAGGDYTYGGAKPDAKYTFTYHDLNSNAYYKGWVVDDADLYAPGQRVENTGKGWYMIDTETATPYSTGWHPEPKDHGYDNGYVHITEYHAANGQTYGEASLYSYAKGEGWASGYDGLGSETDYYQSAGTWHNFVNHGDLV